MPNCTQVIVAGAARTSLLRNQARRYAARCDFPLDQGLAPLANDQAAASRLIGSLLQRFFHRDDCKVVSYRARTWGTRKNGAGPKWLAHGHVRKIPSI
jgi:hypothetical protein